MGDARSLRGLDSRYTRRKRVPHCHRGNAEAATKRCNPLLIAQPLLACEVPDQIKIIEEPADD